MFKSIEYLPLTTEVLHSNLQADPEKALLHKHEMALVYQCALSEQRLIELCDRLVNTLEFVEDRLLAYRHVTDILLCRTLMQSLICSRNGDSSYYRAYRRTNGTKIMPPREQLRAICIGGFKHWGTMYGSLGYFLNIALPHHYASPSELVRTSVNTYLSRLDSQFFGMETDLPRRLIQLINEDNSLSADWLIYTHGTRLLRVVDYVWPTMQHLKFFREWLVKVEYSVEQKCPLVKKVKKIWYEAGISVTNWPLELVYFELPALWGQLYSDLIVVIKQGGESELAAEALRAMPLTTDPDGLRYAQEGLLRLLPGPAGYDLYLMTLASELINRAHIVSCGHEINQAIEKRILGLMHLASLLLKKSSVEEVRTLGKDIGEACGSPFKGSWITDLEVE